MPDQSPTPRTEPEPTPEPGTERTGRDRLLDAIRRPHRGQLAVAALLALVGFAGVTQVQSTEENDTYSGLRTADLIQVLNGLSAASQRAENDITELQESRQELRSTTDNRQAAIQRAREQLDALAILAGTVPAAGPGIRITVEDETGALGIDQLLNGVEELRDAGAEAIEINDQVRVVAQTSFEDSPNGIVVDGQVLESPYVIDVIGSPQTLATALDIRGGFTEELELAGGEVQVEELDNVEVATVRATSTPEFSEPDEDE